MMIGLLAMPPVCAEDKRTDKQKTSELPEMAFLEFLAEMQEVDGQLVAPTDLLSAQQQLGTTGQSDDKAAANEQAQTDISALLEFLNIAGSNTEKSVTTSESGQSESSKTNQTNEEGKQ